MSSKNFKSSILSILFIISWMALLTLMPEKLSAQTGCPYGMSHYWKLDEQSGSPFTDSYGTTNGLCGTTCPTPTTAGNIGGAQIFDGTDNEINIPDDNTLEWTQTDSFSIELWVRFADGNSCDSVQVFVGRDGTSIPGSSLHWWVGCDKTNKSARFFLMDNGGTDGGISGTTDITDGAWHHIVAVRDGGSGKNFLYVDGTEENNKDIVYYDDFSSSVDLNIGWLNLSPYYHFKGYIDEVAIYNRALTPDEFRNITVTVSISILDTGQHFIP